MTPLTPSFLTHPFAHRGLHDLAQGRGENAPASIQAAIDAGYGIEIDVQLSRDGAAMVFHDDHLGRLTNATGLVRDWDAADLAGLPLSGTSDHIPTLTQVLDQVAGQVPMLVEIKDQDGQMGPNLGPLEQATAQALRGYAGDVAVMSFNPHAVAKIAPMLAGIPLGLVTDRYLQSDWPDLNPDVRAHLRGIPDFERAGCSFISHNQAQLDDPAVAALKARGVPVLCWTVRSQADEAQARKLADNITFEGYLP